MNQYSRAQTESHGKRHLRARWKIEPSRLLAVERGFVLHIAPECDSGHRSFPNYRGLQRLTSNKIEVFLSHELDRREDRGHSPDLPALAEGAGDYKSPIFEALFFELFCSRLVDCRRGRGVSLPDT
jgi:hypothetical protein